MDKQNILSELKKGMEAVICEIELQEQSIVKTEEILQSYLHVMKDILRLPDVHPIERRNSQNQRRIPFIHILLLKQNLLKRGNRMYFSVN